MAKIKHAKDRWVSAISGDAVTKTQAMKEEAAAITAWLFTKRPTSRQIEQRIRKSLVRFGVSR